MLCDDGEGDGRGEEEEREHGDEHKCEPEPVSSFAKAHAAFQVVKLLFTRTALASVMRTF
jgi:hypothetical protein